MKMDHAYVERHREKFLRRWYYRMSLFLIKYDYTG
jgi:hypothetical protein